MIADKLFAALALAGAAFIGVAHADTLHLTNGATVDGKVKVTQDGLFEVEAGGNVVYYRPDEVAQHEQNDRDGTLDLDEVKRQVEETQARLTEQTGLTLDQRNRVDELLNRLRSGTPAERLDAQDQLVKMQQEVSLIKYLEHWYNNLVTPELLEAMHIVSAGSFVEELEASVEHRNGACRAKAIELLAKMQRRESVPLLSRGLVDHVHEVQLAAIYAMAALAVRGASPALVELTNNADLKLSNASKQALGIIWKTELGSQEAPADTAGWDAFVKQQAPAQAFQLGELQPLIAPEQEFVYG